MYAPTFRIDCGSVFDANSSKILSTHFTNTTLLGLLCSTLTKYTFKNFIDHSVSSQVEELKKIILLKEKNTRNWIIRFLP